MIVIVTMKLYTKTGDDGSTGLVGGQRLGKDSTRVEACGAVDALNSAIGMAATTCQHTQISAILKIIQNRLFELGTDLMTLCQADVHGATPETEYRLKEIDVSYAEKTIDQISRQLPPMNYFVLPGGSELAARLHVARTTCRLAERRIVTLSRTEAVNHHSLIYLNRLSDLLFALARWANQLEGVEDIPWVSDRNHHHAD